MLWVTLTVQKRIHFSYSGLDKRGGMISIFFLKMQVVGTCYKHPKNICCGYSLEAPCQDACNEYLLLLFS